MWTARKRTVYKYIVDRINQTETIRVCMNFCRAQTKTIGWSQEKLIYALAENWREIVYWKRKAALIQKNVQEFTKINARAPENNLHYFPTRVIFPFAFSSSAFPFCLSFFGFSLKSSLDKIPFFEVFATNRYFSDLYVYIKIRMEIYSKRFRFVNKPQWSEGGWKSVASSFCVCQKSNGEMNQHRYLLFKTKARVLRQRPIYSAPIFIYVYATERAKKKHT